MSHKSTYQLLTVILWSGLMISGCARRGPHGQDPVYWPPTDMRGGSVLDDPERPWLHNKSGKGIYKVGNPYQINGQWYFPKEDLNYEEEGMASWYGPGFHQQVTANGETFDTYTLSAAHRTLPLPSVAHVTNLENGKSVVVRVNDRGPFARDRIIDLSSRAADMLGFKAKGTARVRVRILPEESLTVMALSQNRTAARTQVISPQDISNGMVSAAPLEDLFNMDAAPTTAPKIQAILPATAAPLLKGKFMIQVAAYGNPDTAQSVGAYLKRFGPVVMTPVTTGPVTLYRLRLGPYETQVKAEKTQQLLLQSGYPEARIIDNSTK